MSDLNDARVQAFDRARVFGLSLEQFNWLWNTIVPVAIKHGEDRHAS